MTTDYKIDFTDQNETRRVSIRPYTTNGTKNPTSPVLDDKATIASTSLLLYGKGNPNYGERTAENFVHLLENFASENEPVFPIAGQIWYKRSSTDPSQLFVYNPTSHELISIAVLSADTCEISVEGDISSRINLAPPTRFQVVDTTVAPEVYTEVTPSAVIFDGTYTKITVSPVVSTPSAGKYIGGWDGVQQDNIDPQTDFDFQDQYHIINPADPTDDSHVGDRAYNDARYVNVAGDTMTGTLVLSGAPTSDLQAATKKYVDDELVATAATLTPLGTCVQISGDTMTGHLTLVGNPTDPLHAATKQYVDVVAASGPSVPTVLDDLLDVSIPSTPANNHLLSYDFGTNMWTNKSAASAGVLSLSGGTMTGQLVLAGNPIGALDAVPSQWLESRLSGITGGLFSVVQSGTFTGNTLTFQRTDGSTFSVTGISTSGGEYDSDVTHISNPPYQYGVDGDQIEESYWNFPNYPNVPLNEAIEVLSQIAHSSRQKNKRKVFPSLVVATHTGLPEFVCGFNTLQLYVNGVKQIANERGYQAIYHDALNPSSTQIAGFHPGIATGLANDATVYSMSVTVDGGAPITVSVVGQDAQQFGSLIEEINNDLGWNATAIIEEEAIYIYSATTGSSSSISISDTNLISSLVGEQPTGATVWNSSTTYFPGDKVSYTSGSPSTTVYYVALKSNTNFDPPSHPNDWRQILSYIPTINTAVAGVTYGFSENGPYGFLSSSITFEASSIPTSGSTIEAISIGQQRQYGRG